METRQMEVFVAVVDAGSFTGAAVRLMIAQPAVSQAIKQLEADLGVHLMDRDRGGIRLTASGEALYARAKRVLYDVEQATRHTKLAALGMVGTLRIGYLASATSPFLPDLLRKYRTNWPMVNLECFEMTPKEQIEAFQTDRIDVGFSRGLPGAFRDGFHSTKVYEDRFTVVVAADSRWAEVSPMHPRMLREESFVLFERSHAPDLYDYSIMICEDFSPRVISTPPLMSTVILLVASGLGVSIAPGCVRFLRQGGLVYHCIDGCPCRIDLEMHWRRGESNLLVQNWVRLVEEQKPAIEQRMVLDEPVFVCR